MTNNINSFHGVYNDWQYYFSMGENDIPKIEIIPNQKYSAPKQLCKYYFFTSYNVKALANKYFYGSHPFDLNDPFDVNPSMLSLDRKILNDAYNLLFSHLGILSMTCSDIDPQMWSYYTSHFGYVVNYSIESIPKNFLGPFPMNYIDDYILPNQYNPVLQLVIASNLKYRKYWAHENEWRFLLCSSELLKLPKVLQNKLNPNIRSRKCRYFNYSGFFSIKEVVIGYKLILNAKNRILIVPNAGIEITTQDSLFIKFLNLIITKKYKVSILDIHPDEYPNFIKIAVQIQPLKRDKFFFKYIF
jgi:hypothetical protein